MIKYRKTDQEYEDDYDRYTIKYLKELEKKLGDKIYHTSIVTEIGELKLDFPTAKYSPVTLFFDTAVRRAQGREEAIQERKQADENKDRLVRETPVPKNVRCKKCSAEMSLETYMFKDNDTSLYYVFICPNKHVPKRVLHSDGQREWIFEPLSCKKCGGGLKSETIEKKNSLQFVDTCLSCGKVTKTKHHLDPIIKITEADRKKYCMDWIGKRTFFQDLQAIADFMEYHKEAEKLNETKKDYGVDKIERVNVPKLEDRLSKVAEELGFIKFKFENTSTKGFVIISFSAQDPTERNEKESIKELARGIKKSVFPTNWRLMTDGLDYRLGVLTGRLKAHEDDESLLKIAKEIQNTKNDS